LKGDLKVNVSTNEVWEEFSNRLKEYIFKRVQNECDAEDILQDVFCKIHSNLDKLKDLDKLSAWVYQTTRNAIIDYYRGRKPISELSETNVDINNNHRTDNINKLIMPCLKPMIDHLPEKYRQAISLVYVEGMTQKQMAEKLGLSFSGAKSRVQRAREKLKEMLLECCRFEFDRTGNIIDYRYKLKQNRCCSSKSPGE